jgi:hypothetical protein
MNFLNNLKEMANPCSICLLDIENNNENGNIKLLSCGHSFHANCINTWLENNNTCPYCRSIHVDIKSRFYTIAPGIYILAILILNLGLCGYNLEDPDTYGFILSMFYLVVFIDIIMYNIIYIFQSNAIYCINSVNNMCEIFIILIYMTCVYYIIDYKERLKDKSIYLHIFVINMVIHITIILCLSKCRAVKFVEKYLLVNNYIV